eukprot:5852741-Amphidinium_carterae.1
MQCPWNEILKSIQKEEVSLLTRVHLVDTIALKEESATLEDVQFNEENIKDSLTGTCVGCPESSKTILRIDEVAPSISLFIHSLPTYPFRTDQCEDLKDSDPQIINLIVAMAYQPGMFRAGSKIVSLANDFLQLGLLSVYKDRERSQDPSESWGPAKP